MSKYQISHDKDRFKVWELSQPSLPIFLQSWWWDIVTQGIEWMPTMLIGPDDRIEGIVLQQHKTKYGIKISLPPLLCPYQGPWISTHQDDNRSFVKSTMNRWQLQTNLIQGLPKNSVSVLHTLPDEMDHLAYAWQGYKQTSRYTFIIEDISDPERCFANFKGNIRTNIRKASALLQVEESMDLEAFYKLHTASFDRQKIKSPISLQLMQQIFEKVTSKKAGSLHIAKDHQGKAYAGALTINDNEKVYILISGIDASLGNIGALNLVYWEVIKHYVDKVKALDFEGSMLAGVAPVFLGFGAKPYRYHRLVRFPNRWIAGAATLLNKGI